jgi:hypothetical protein
MAATVTLVKGLAALITARFAALTLGHRSSDHSSTGRDAGAV